MSTPSRKRLMRDFKRLQQDPPAGISGAPQDNNIMLWNAVIFGYVLPPTYISLYIISVCWHSCVYIYVDVFECVHMEEGCAFICGYGYEHGHGHGWMCGHVQLYASIGMVHCVCAYVSACVCLCF